MTNDDKEIQKIQVLSNRMVDKMQNDYSEVKKQLMEKQDYLEGFKAYNEVTSQFINDLLNRNQTKDTMLKQKDEKMAELNKTIEEQKKAIIALNKKIMGKNIVDKLEADDQTHLKQAIVNKIHDNSPSESSEA